MAAFCVQCMGLVSGCNTHSADGRDYYLKSDLERGLVRKLDCAMLSVLCFGWLMKYIDQTNVRDRIVLGTAHACSSRTPMSAA